MNISKSERIWRKEIRKKIRNITLERKQLLEEQRKLKQQLFNSKAYYGE